MPHLRMTKGYNPKKRGRGAHHPPQAVFGEACLILSGWLRSGNTHADTGVVELLKEALAKRESLEWICRVRSGSGFFERELLEYLKELKLGYVGSKLAGTVANLRTASGSVKLFHKQRS